MMEFLIFYAPFIVLIGSIIIAFWVSTMDGPVRDE
ncbi:cytochrome bd oxidase small subunit CydS [Psychrobacillus sp. FSL W7-1493]